ncbi:MAG: MoxR family ATPase [Acidobacteria bacterium]|nr:MoxR family ATPase [Acidobacteriota bacterium]
MTTKPITTSDATAKVAALQENIERVIRGKSEVVRYAIASMLARGHILLEDVPGVGKTTLAHALARSVSVEFQRIQFTSDLLPSDIVGVMVFNQDRQQFEFLSGPVFTNVLLADEINRATPKTQSALLEAMNEGTVTVEKQHLPLPDPFVVVATQNPVEHVGTYPLPESQLDRFLMKLTIGYPNKTDERELLKAGGAEDALANLQPVLSAAELLALQNRVSDIHVSDALLDYLMSLVEATRNDSEIALGVSTRGSLTFYRASQALAMVYGRDFVTPDDVKRLAVPVLAHRVVLHERHVRHGDLTPEARVIERLVSQTPVPR